MSGEGVYLSPRECASLSLVLKAAQRAVRRNGLDLPLLEAAQLVHAAAAAYERTVNTAVQQVATLTGTSFVDRGSEASLSNWVSVAVAAEVLSVSDTYVRRLCRQEALKARRNDEGAWEVDERSARELARARTVSARTRGRRN